MSKRLLSAMIILVLGLPLMVYLVFAAPYGLVFPAKRPPATRGVILIISDALRADHLSCYGYPRKTSPNIDALAKGGVLFQHAYSQCSWTTASVASIFTSMYPSVHRTGHTKSRFGYVSSLHSNATTLAELMEQHGYRTIGVCNNPTISANLGFDQGFEIYENDEEISEVGPTPESYSKVIDYLELLKDDRFFLVWHLIDPHWPYWPPSEFRGFVDKTYRGRFRKSFVSRYANPLVNGKMKITKV